MNTQSMSEWQTLDTCPSPGHTDGLPVWVYGRRDCGVELVRPDGDWWRCHRDVSPTHWQPLIVPAAPP